MTIFDGIKAFLTAQGFTRVYASMAPNPLPAPTTDPYTVIYLVTADPQHTHGGPVRRYIQQTFQLSTFAESQSAAYTIGAAIRNAMDGHVGVFGTIPVSSVMWSTTFSSYDETAKRHQIANDFRITYKE